MNRITILWDKYKTNKIIQQDGFGPLRASGLISFLNHQCTYCHSKISITALSNALEITQTGIVFLCMKCREVEHQLSAEEIKDLKEDKRGMIWYWHPEKNSFKTFHINQYRIITFLHKHYQQSINDKDVLFLFDLVMYFRLGVTGYPQSAWLYSEYEKNWSEYQNSVHVRIPKRIFHSIYDSWRNLGHCPECGHSFNLHQEEVKEMGESGLCIGCKIPFTAYWTYRNSHKSDLEKLIKFDNPENSELHEAILESFEDNED